MDLFVTFPIVNDGNVNEVLSLDQRLGICLSSLYSVNACSASDRFLYSALSQGSMAASYSLTSL